MIGKVKDIIEDEDSAIAMIQIPKEKAAELWKMVGKEVVITWLR